MPDSFGRRSRPTDTRKPPCGLGRPCRPHDRKGGPHGCDGGKKVNGRKRHLLVDTGGLVLGCVVTPANVGDREGARLLLHLGHPAWPRLSHIWAAGNYGGPLVQEVKNVYGYDLEIVAGPSGQRGFSVLPRRWVVERTFSWLGKCRRLSKDYEQRPCTERAFINVAMSGLMLRRPAK